MVHLSPISALARFDSLSVLDLDLGTDATNTIEPCSAAHVTAWWHDIPLGVAVVEFDQEPGEWTTELDRTEEALRQRFAREIERARLTVAAFPTPTRGTDYCVAVCTADRPESLARCLESLRHLDARCSRVIIVDNSRTRSDEVADVVAEYGYDYVREPRPGLDRARNRALVTASTDVVLFTDDDVEILPGWDRWLVDGFDDPLVMATGGLVLPASLAGENQVRSEQFSSHGRGFNHRRYNTPHLFPDHTPVSGNPNTPAVGASMAVRRAFALGAGGYPEELDAGMPTGTGGDTWMYRTILERGYRVVYEPRAVVRHWHRDDHASLTAMFAANACGVWALNWRRLAHDRHRKAALDAMRYTTRWHRENLRRIRTGHPEALPRSLMLSELRGAVRSPFAYRRALTLTGARRSVVDELGSTIELPAPWLDRAMTTRRAIERVPQGDSDPLTVSVVIPTRGRKAWCVELTEQLLASDEIHEIVIAIDGDLDGTEAALRELANRAPTNQRLRWIVLDDIGSDADHGSGAGTARNAGARLATGDLLLFLDDDVLPLGDDLVAGHRRAHAEAGELAVVIGSALVDGRSAVRRDLIEGRNWWVDQVGRLNTEPRLAFSDVCTGNLSIRRDDFDRLGGFPDLARREDWLFGLRVQAHGLNLRPAATATVLQREQSRSTGRFDRHRDGHSDARILAEFPHYRERIDPNLLPTGGRAATVSNLVGRHPLLYDMAEPIVYGLARRLPAQSLIRWRLGRLLTVAGYWAGAARAGGTAGNPLRASTGTAPAKPAADLDMTCADTPSVAATGALVRILDGDRPLGFASAHRAGQVLSTNLFRRCLIDRFAPSTELDADQ